MGNWFQRFCLHGNWKYNTNRTYRFCYFCRKPEKVNRDADS